MLINVLNHTLDMGIGELQEIRAQLDAGTIRLLAVVGDERLPQFPDLKTVEGTGHRSVGAQVPRARRPQGHAARRSSRRGRRRSPGCSTIPNTSSSTPRTACSPASSARRVRQVHGRVRQGDRGVSQGVRRHRVMTQGPAPFGTATLALSVGYYWMAAGIPTSQLADAIGPQGLPKTYAILLAALSLDPDRAIARSAGRTYADRHGRSRRPVRPYAIVAGGRHAGDRHRLYRGRAVARLHCSRWPG